MYGYTPTCFSVIISMGNNFCDFVFASLDKTALEIGSILKGKNLLLGSKFFSLRLDPLRFDPFEKGGKNESGRVAYPENVSINLKS